MSKNTKPDLEMDFAYLARAAFLGITIGFAFCFLVYNFKRSSNEKPSPVEAVQALDRKNDQITQMDKLVHKTAVAHNLDPADFLCVLKIESSLKLNSISDTGDYGIGQINIKTWKQFEPERLLKDLQYSLNASASILSYYKQLKAQEEPETWVCRYNVGPGSLQRSSRYEACQAYLNKFFKCLDEL